MIDSNLMIAGLDDAGRGAIIGPLVIAGIRMQEKELAVLTKLKVKDSKLLSPSARVNLYPEILKVSKHAVIKVPPKTIDEYVLRGKKLKRLNYLEALVMARVVKKLDPDVAYVDASDVNPERYRKDILHELSKEIKIISTHRAESLYPIVAAASIIAKVERDREIAKIEEQYTGIGTGYPSDPKTRRFLRSWLSSRGNMPSFTRRSWKTWERLSSKDLRDF